MDIETKLGEWVKAGLISAKQAEAIRSAEDPVRRTVSRVPLAAQALGYLGASLAAVAAGVTVARFWEDLESWSKLTLAALTTLVLLIGGAWAARSREPAFSRLTGFLWFLAAGGMAFFVVLVAVEQFDAAVPSTAFSAGLVTSVFALVLWLMRPSGMQQTAVFAALVATALGALSLLEHPPYGYFGLAVWGLGLAWAVLAWGGIMRPEIVGYVLACLALLAGAQSFALDTTRDTGLVVGLLTAVGLIAVSVPFRRGVMLAFGAAGVFLFVPQAVYEWLGEALGASLALFLAGVLLVVMAVVLGRLRNAVEEATD